MRRCCSCSHWSTTPTTAPGCCATTRTRLRPDAAARLSEMTQRRLNGEPLAYIQGEKAFFGLRLKVDARVLVPRPDTETLVEWSLDALDTAARTAALSGSGHRQWRHRAGRQKPASAMRRSQRPTPAPMHWLWPAPMQPRLGLAVTFRQGSWLHAVAGERFHVIASNPPYIAEGDHHLPALTHEPITALTAGADGLERHARPGRHRARCAGARRLAAAGAWPRSGSSGARRCCPPEDFEQVSSRTDLAGIQRCSGGQWPKRR